MGKAKDVDFSFSLFLLMSGKVEGTPAKGRKQARVIYN